jgi:HD superfamily phosphohydrolase
MDPIHFDDPVYGEVRFTEPLLIELYASEAVQRLRQIHQGGITAFIRPERRTTRLEHSRGVAALLRLLGADFVEQAAGLVHDVAHTAFSHVIDFVFPNEDHVYHEVHREQTIAASDLPSILGRHGLDWRWVTDAGNFPLLEQPLPLLCADRLDYFLRDAIVDFGLFSRDDAQALLSHLHPYQAQIIVDDVAAARWLGERFIDLDDLCWCSTQEVGWYAVMAHALRTALSHGIIVEADFAGTDAELLERLRNAGSPDVDAWLKLLRREVDFVRSPAGAHVADGLEVLPKVRAIDPPTLVNGQVVPLSRIDSGFARHRQDYVAGKQGRWTLKVAGEGLCGLGPCTPVQIRERSCAFPESR